MFTFLASFLHSPWMLLGLVVLAIPPIIHLLNRRRYDVVDWGAMQFLQLGELTRRRLLLEEVLLMLLRMGLLGVFVLGLAGPFFDSTLPARLGVRTKRDVVLVIDGSASMSATDERGGKSPFERARDWALAFIDELGSGDTVAVFQAKDQVITVVGELSHDLGRIRDRLRRMPEPAGSANWPEAIKRAFAALESSQKSDREVILLGDNQKFGWADTDTLFRWELLAGQLGLGRSEGASRARPRLWAVNVADERSAQPPNWALGPLRGNRPVVPVDREVTFQAELMLFGQKSYTPPYRIRLEVDGKHIRDLPPPGGRGSGMPLPKDGRVPFSFANRFQAAGSHLVSVILEPDPPPEDRPRGYVVKDRVPGDNRQDFSVEVVKAIPVLLVDGESSVAAPGNLGTDFLRDALMPARDRNPAVRARVVTLNDFTPGLLSAKHPPRVVVLHNVPRVSQVQNEAVSTFLNEGGGVLVTLGERVEADLYNDQLYRGGEGWLPARLERIVGDEAKPKDAARPDALSFNHPTLELFRRVTVGGLTEARFPRWWRLSTPGRHAPGVPVGQLQSGGQKDPFFVERAVQAGRVVLAAVPLDNSWGTNLTELPAFVPLVHELIYYLAGARSAEFNLRAGQPIRYRMDEEVPLEQFRLQPPTGPARPLSARPGEPGTYLAQVVRQEKGAVLVYDDARETGVYRLTTPAKHPVYYVVAPDPRESDLTACTQVERDRVGKLIGVRYEDERSAMVREWATGVQRQDLWLYLLLGVVALLCLEVWMTRRLVMKR